MPLASQSRYPIIAELARARAKRSSGARWVSKSPHPRKFGNQVTVHRTNDRPSIRTTGIPMFPITLSIYFGSPGENWLHINVVINWQLSKQGIRWPVSPDRTAGSSVDPSRSSTFLKLSADKLPVSNDRRLKSIFSNDSYEICCVYVTMAPHY